MISLFRLTRSMALVSLGWVAVASATPALAKRPVDVFYEENPKKRAADVEELKSLCKGLEAQHAAALKSVAKKKNKLEANRSLVGIARTAGKILILYEGLGLNFANKKLGYPHYLLYKLESYLQGKKKVKNRDGTVTIKPANPEGARILSYANLLSTPGAPRKKLKPEVLDTKKLSVAADKIMGFMRDLILSQKQILDAAK